jgi:hypothetical protein
VYAHTGLYHWTVGFVEICFHRLEVTTVPMLCLLQALHQFYTMFTIVYGKKIKKSSCNTRKNSLMVHFHNLVFQCIFLYCVILLCWFYLWIIKISWCLQVSLDYAVTWVLVLAIGGPWTVEERRIGEHNFSNPLL